VHWPLPLVVHVAGPAAAPPQAALTTTPERVRWDASCTVTTTCAFHPERRIRAEPSRSPTWSAGTGAGVLVAVGTAVFVAVGVLVAVSAGVLVAAGGVAVGEAPASAATAARASISPQPYAGSHPAAPRSRAVARISARTWSGVSVASSPSSSA